MTTINPYADLKQKVHEASLRRLDPDLTTEEKIALTFEYLLLRENLYQLSTDYFLEHSTKNPTNEIFDLLYRENKSLLHVTKEAIQDVEALFGSRR